MTRLSATEVAREFSAVVNRIGAGEEIEVVRNGVAVVQMRQANPGHLVSSARWRELMDSAPSPDQDFAHDAELGEKPLARRVAYGHPDRYLCAGRRRAAGAIAGSGDR